MSIKKLWNYPTEMEEAMWYILLGVFITLWMCMILWN